MQPRIKPLSLEEADPQTRELLGRLISIKGPNSRIPNIFGTVANNPELLRQWLGFTTYLLTASTLEPRLRELVILRVGWLCHSPYEWGQHVIVGRRVGLTDEDLARIAQGPAQEGWSPAEAAALRAADELVDHCTLSDDTWAAVTAFLTTQQVLDLVFLVGQYRLVSSALNALRIERDDGLDAAQVLFPPAVD